MYLTQSRDLDWKKSGQKRQDQKTSCERKQRSIFPASLGHKHWQLYSSVQKCTAIVHAVVRSKGKKPSVLWGFFEKFPRRFSVFGIVKYLLIGNTLKIVLHLSKDTERHKYLKKIIAFFQSNFHAYGQFLVVVSAWQSQKGCWVGLSSYLPEDRRLLGIFPSVLWCIFICRHLNKDLLIQSMCAYSS